MALLSRDKFEKFDKRLYLSTPTMHGDELRYMTLAYETNWMSTVGENINEVERQLQERIGVKCAVGLASGTAALHLAVRLAGVKRGDRVFCTDMTFAATVNPITYEGGVPVFIDTEPETWNMDPEALRRAFAIYPDTKFVMLANLYGTPARLDEILEIVREHNAILIEDAAESLGATYRGKETGSFGDISVISFNGNKIITGSSGGMLLTDDEDMAAFARKLSTQARENAPWYQHEYIGYNYRMSNVIAGVVRGQIPYLSEHISAKRAIYERYRKGFLGLPIKMNPYDAENSEPNFWLSCAIIDKEAMAEQKRGDLTVEYARERGRSTPSEILDALAEINAEGRPIWKPMHMQPTYRQSELITRDGIRHSGDECVSRDIFERGLCLPSDNKMTAAEQDRIIALIRACFE